MGISKKSLRNFIMRLLNYGDLSDMSEAFHTLQR